MGIAFQDESDILYVNTRCQDDTDVGRLCHDFHASDAEMVYDDILRERMRALKDSKEGDSYMCELVDELMREVEEKVRKQEHDKGFAEGRTEVKIAMAKRLRKEGLSDEVIARVASASVEQVKEWFR